MAINEVPWGAMSVHRDRVRAVLLVHGLDADCRDYLGSPVTIADLTDRVIRIRARLHAARCAGPADGVDPRHVVDRGAEAAEWMLAVYDAALVGLCRAVGMPQALLDEGVCAELERQRVELALRSSALPVGWPGLRKTQDGINAAPPHIGATRRDSGQRGNHPEMITMGHIHRLAEGAWWLQGRTARRPFN